MPILKRVRIPTKEHALQIALREAISSKSAYVRNLRDLNEDHDPKLTQEIIQDEALINTWKRLLHESKHGVRPRPLGTHKGHVAEARH